MIDAITFMVLYFFPILGIILSTFFYIKLKKKLDYIEDLLVDLSKNRNFI